MEQIVAALGGSGNVESIQTCSSRLRVGIVRSESVDQEKLVSLGVRAVVTAAPRVLHVVIGPAADALAQSLRKCLSTASAG
jgi:PTS system N-acetylglucosamine-specific IIC component